MRILVIRFSSLGDVALTLPIFKRLRSAYPDATISALVKEAYADLLRGEPSINNVITMAKGESIWSLSRRIQEGRFDAILDLHANLRSRVIAWRSGAKRVVRYHKAALARRAYVAARIKSPLLKLHTVERYLEALGRLAPEFPLTSPRWEKWLDPNPEALETVQSRLKSLGVSPKDRLVAFHAGAHWATKRWLPEGFAAVGDRVMKELSAKVIFLGDKMDQETMKAILPMMKEKPINWVGETTVKELVAVISRCQAFLTNDSGPLHLAVGTGVRTVALFGPTTRELGFFPYGSGHWVIERELKCRPCTLHGSDRCPLGHFRCMREITPDIVFDALRRTLS